MVLNRARCDLLFKSNLFTHNFTNVLDPNCSCGYHHQSTHHVLFHCPLLINQRNEYIAGIESIPALDLDRLNAIPTKDRIDIILHGSSNFRHSAILQVLSKTADFLEFAVQFYQSLQV